jgi:hypothetical protein
MIDAPVTFVLGVPRSGTTLLRVMLAGHPQLFVPPEMVMAPFETMAERKAFLDARFWEKGGLRRALMHLRGCDAEEAKALEGSLDALTTESAYAWLMGQLGGRMLVDKCPHLAFEPAWMERVAQTFPQARYVWIQRHPGSVIRSLQNMPMAEVMLQGFGGSADEAWVRLNTNLRAFLANVPRERQAVVVYEELVRDPRAALEPACRAMGVAFHPALLDPYEGDRMRDGQKGARAIGDPNMAGRGRIDPELATKWLDGWDPASASPALRTLAGELGYDLSTLERPPIVRVSAAMDSLWDAARALERSIDAPADIDAVEGRRFLGRMVAAAWDTCVESSDPDRPVFAHVEGPHRKMFADNPDTDYLRAPVRLGPGRAYHVSGRAFPDTTYFAVLAYGRGGRVGKQLRDDQIARNPDGTWEVVVSTERPAAADDWLDADADTEAIIVRQYFSDRATQASVAPKVAYLGVPAAPAPLDAATLANGVDRSTRMLNAVWRRTTRAHAMARTALLNRFGEIPAGDLFPTPDNAYRVCWWRFGEDQLMFLRGQLPRARYFNLSLCNAWLESFDYTRHRVTLNHRELFTDADGRFEVVLSHTPVAHPNNLVTAGHSAGYCIARALCAEGAVPPIEVEVKYAREWSAS